MTLTVFYNIQFLYAALNECFKTDQANLLAHPYGEHNNTSSIYLELRTHSQAFIMEQLSHDTLLKYMWKLQNLESGDIHCSL
jgi:hypothetical protein